MPEFARIHALLIHARTRELTAVQFQASLGAVSTPELVQFLAAEGVHVIPTRLEAIVALTEDFLG